MRWISVSQFSSEDREVYFALKSEFVLCSSACLFGLRQSCAASGSGSSQTTRSKAFCSARLCQGALISDMILFL